MADYMRHIIYLKRIEQDGQVLDGGFVRLEQRQDRLCIYLMAEDEFALGEQPVYVVWQRVDGLFPQPLGKICSGKKCECEKISGEKGRLCGVLIGSPECYLTGTCLDYHKPLSMELIGKKQEEEYMEPQKPVVPEKPEKPERPEKAEPIEVEKEELPAQEPEKAKDPLLEKFAEMYPFEDDEIEWCLQIEPGDFSSFPMEYWHFGKNSFLLQGFYNYRHLLYAHTKEKNYIGVPGQFHRREQYLASRFGFPRFKGTQKKRTTIGDFGYWMKEI